MDKSESNSTAVPRCRHADPVTARSRPAFADLDRSAGCTIKDSFAALDLTAHGFRVLFEAQWITAPAYPQSAWTVPAGVDPDHGP